MRRSMPPDCVLTKMKDAMDKSVEEWQKQEFESTIDHRVI